VSKSAPACRIVPVSAHLPKSKCMTETTLSAIAPTALAAAIAAEPAPPLFAPYRGVLTPQNFTPQPIAPQHLDASQAEIAAILTSAAVHDMGWQRRIAVRGEDRSRWLSGMVTNAVETLPDHSGAYNLILNAQGRIQGDTLVWHTGDSLELEIEAGQFEAILAHLDHFIIMDDVELVPLTSVTALGLSGPDAAKLLAILSLPAPDVDLTYAEAQFDGHTIRVARNHSPLVPRFTLWIDESHTTALFQRLKAAGAIPAGAASLETLRIVEGTPAYGQDIQSRDLAQETSLTRALNFTKGCYLGQEIVERIRSRGQVHRHLRQLEIFPADTSAELPSPGVELQLNGKPAGALTSITAVQLQDSRRIFAIGMIRAEAELTERSGALLDYPGGHARLLQVPPRFSGNE
jgi:folate-binding protein YgfZ